jgi:hypothetical protein
LSYHHPSPEQPFSPAAVAADAAQPGHHYALKSTEAYSPASAPNILNNNTNELKPAAAAYGIDDTSGPHLSSRYQASWNAAHYAAAPTPYSPSPGKESSYSDYSAYAMLSKTEAHHGGAPQVAHTPVARPSSLGIQAHGLTNGSKLEGPYAALIYEALMSRPDHCMTLQEIYQWFRDNTIKADGTSKGWQNSIRHNLSMNGVSASFYTHYLSLQDYISLPSLIHSLPFTC